MNVAKIYKKSKQKGLLVTEKYQKKMRIIEENVNLSDEEKLQAYGRLIQKVEKESQKNEKKGERSKKFYSKVSEMMDDGRNIITGNVGLLSTIIGGVCLASSSLTACIPATVLYGTLTTLGAGVTTLAGITFENGNGNSVLENIETKNMYDTIFTREALENVNKKLKELTSPEAEVQLEV